MRRRELLFASFWLPFFAPSAQAQSRADATKVAILSPGVSSVELASGSLLSKFIQAMHELGYIEGRSIRTEVRFAENQLDRLPALASDLVAWGPDVIYTYTSGGALAAAGATKNIPIVVGPAGESVLIALAGNLAHPTGNVTGVSLEGFGLYEKCLELLKEMAPRLARIGVLVNPDNPAWADFPAIVDPAAVQLRLVLVRVASRGQVDIERALAGVSEENLDALLVTNDLAFSPDDLVGARIVEFARERHLPSASTASPYARRGGLLALGTDQFYLRRRAAEYVSRIIEGAKPGDLPMERPSKFHLSVNLLTAKAIGLTVPPSLLARADEVID
jgi:putative ABC transport system substrate-binding protein